MNGFKVFCLVLKFREKKRTFAKVEGGNVDFFSSVRLWALCIEVIENTGPAYTTWQLLGGLKLCCSAANIPLQCPL
jgi:hypothetical protein